MKILPCGIAVIEGDKWISKWVEEHGALQHDYQTLPEVLGQISAGDYVLDCGACLGDTAKPFLDKVGSNGFVYAIEPNRAAYECLAYNMLNFAGDNIRLLHAAVGDKPGIARLTADANAGGAHLNEHTGEAVTVVRIDDLGLTRCEFLKLDIEGYELHALRGAEQTITKFRPTLLIEINPGALERQGTTPDDIYQWLRAHHYEWRELVPSNGGDAPQTDILCVPHKAEVRIKNEEEFPNSSFLLQPSAALTPWADKAQTLAYIASAGQDLRRFCTTPRYTGFVRDVLREQKVIK